MNSGRHVNRLPANCSYQQQKSSDKYPNDLFESDETVRKHGRMAQLVVPTGYFVEISHGRMAQLVEHIVHIDGVTGSSPVATTNPRKSLKNQGLSSFLSAPPGVQNEHADRVHFFDMNGLCSCTCSHRVDVDGLAVRVASLLVFDVNRLPVRVVFLPVFDVNGSLARDERLAG